jgi:hypothetical protein
MELNEESSDFVYLGKRIDKALDYIQNSKTNLLDWFKQYVEIPYQDIMSGELDLEEEDYTFDYLDSLLDDLEKKFNVIFETKNKMTQEQLRMQFLSGVITESEYKSMLNENSSKIKDILSKIGDIEEKIYDKYNDEEIDAKFDYSKALDGIKEKYKNDEGKMYDALVSHLNKLKKSFPLQENKESINENFVGIGAINNPFIDRKKETYEDAFEYFLNSKYELNEGEEIEEIEEAEEKEDELEEGKEVEEPNNY